VECRRDSVLSIKNIGKGDTMVRVVIEHKIKGPAYVDKAIDLIREIRNEAMKEHGFITGETLTNVDDPTNMLVISNWESRDAWDAWDKSEKRVKLNPGINQLLAEPYSVRIFEYYMIQRKRVMSI
jgi:heme-degrading monooxygenase HmoA